MIDEQANHIPDLADGVPHDIQRLGVAPLQGKILPDQDACLVTRGVELLAVDVDAHAHPIDVRVAQQGDVLVDRGLVVLPEPEGGDDVGAANEHARAVQPPLPTLGIELDFSNTDFDCLAVNRLVLTQQLDPAWLQMWRAEIPRPPELWVGNLHDDRVASALRRQVHRSDNGWLVADGDTEVIRAWSAVQLDVDQHERLFRDIPRDRPLPL